MTIRRTIIAIGVAAVIAAGSACAPPAAPTPPARGPATTTTVAGPAPVTVVDITFTGTCAQPGELGIWTFTFTLYLSDSTTLDRTVTVDARTEDKAGTIKTDQRYGSLPSWINWQASATSCSTQSDGPPRPG